MLAALFCAGCGTGEEGAGVRVKSEPFGRTATGQEIDRYTLENASGMQVGIINYGGIVTSIRTPDRGGQITDVVLGFDSLDGYLGTHPYFGAIVGRYGNRIAKGRFTLDGIEYKLARNDGENALHGGVRGFDKQIWRAREIPSGVELRYLSKDGEEGYPGALDVTVTYTLNGENELKIEYAAVTDRQTVVNLTNHSYFNLSGQGDGDILGHEVTINADRFTPVDAGLIPTGEAAPVEGTPFDFRKPTAIGARIHEDDEQLLRGKGYDHNFVLNSSGSRLSLAARVKDPKSGRVLEVLTDQPGVQFYAGNFLDGSVKGKGGRAYGQRQGFCLETQHFPDSPNQPGFPSTVLKPGERYRTTTIFRFRAPR
jgi:aldose 1-epimerase